MADSLILRGYTHLTHQKGNELKKVTPPHGRAHWSLARWWVLGRKAFYIPCVRLDWPKGTIFVSGNRTMRLHIMVDGCDVKFNSDHNMRGVDRIMVTNQVGSKDFDDYIVLPTEKLVKETVGAGFQCHPAIQIGSVKINGSGTQQFYGAGHVEDFYALQRSGAADPADVETWEIFHHGTTTLADPTESRLVRTNPRGAELYFGQPGEYDVKVTISNPYGTDSPQSDVVHVRAFP
jgi:hypothetical protein